MKIVVCGDLGKFRDELARNYRVIALVTGRALMSAAEVVALDAMLQQAAILQIEDVAEAREATERHIVKFFKLAADADPGFHWGFSAGVPLSITGYRDLQQVFALWVLRDLPREETVVALFPDKELRSLVEAWRRRFTVVRFPGIRAWLKVSRSVLRWGMNRPAKGFASTILFFSLRHSSGNVERDIYFGALSRLLGKPVGTVFLAAGNQIWFPANGKYAPVESFLTISDVLAAIWATIKDGFHCWENGAEKNTEYGRVAAYLRRQEQRTGENFTGHMLERAALRIGNRLNPKAVMFPFENRSWERRLVGGLRRAGVVPIVGYQHSSVTRRHLAFRLGDRENAMDETLPDRIVTVGEKTRQWLVQESPVIADRIAVGGSLRRVVDTVAPPKEKAVLLAISSSREEAIAVLRYAWVACSESDCRFIIRTHPVVPVKELFDCFCWPSNVELSQGVSLAEDLSRVSCVAYASSTVAIEGMLYGRLPIYIDVGDIPDGDPIFKKEEFSFSVAEPAKFAAQLDEIFSMPDSRRQVLCRRAMVYAQSYLRLVDKKALAVFRSSLNLE